MGAIAEYARGGKAGGLSSPSREGAATWRQIFGNTSKEDTEGFPRVRPEARSDSVLSTNNATKRLLQALRSRAPGGWTDDRWEQSKHMLGMVYSAIHRVGEQMAQSEFQVMRKDKQTAGGMRPVQEGEEGYELVQLLERPNNEDSFGDLLYNWNMQMDLTGTALTWMVPNYYGKPFEIYPIPTATAIPQPVLDPSYPDGFYRIQPLYPYGPFSSYPTPSSAVGAPIDARWVMRFKYPHPLLRYDGYAPLTAMRSYIDQLESIDRSRWYSMKRTVNPSATLNFDEIEGMEPLNDEAIDRLIAAFEAAHQGPENTGQLFVCPPGGKLEPWGGRPVDMDWTQGWEQISSFVLGGGFGITKEAAGMIQQSSYSNLFAALKQLYWLTLEPKVNRIASKLTRFLAPYFGNDLIVLIRCKRIDDHDIRNARIEKLMSAKAITKNEVRRELDMPLTEEEWGDEIAGEPPGGGQQDMMGGMMGGDMGMEEGGADLFEEEGEDLFLDDEGGLEDDSLFLDEEDEAEADRPRTGPLGEGSLGPRMKLLTNRIRHILVGANGTNGHHHNGR